MRLLDLDDQAPGSYSDAAGSAMLYLAPPPREGDDDPRLGRWLAAMGSAPPERLVYASTSAVYGDCGGDWIDETRALAPQSARGRRRASAEERASQWCAERGVRLIVLRIAGIYGPGKLPLERLRAGEPVLRSEDCPWMNLIHAHDVVRAYRAALEGNPDHHVYNLASGAPTTMALYMDAVADAAGLPRPRKLTRDEAERLLRPSFLAFLRESKRLDVARLRESLAAPRFTRLEEGLRHALAGVLDDAL